MRLWGTAAGGQCATRLAAAGARDRPASRRRVLAAGVPQPTQQAYTALCDAVAAQGGFIHPSLQLASDGGGIAAARPVPVPHGSLVELPLGMRLTSEAAQELLLPVLNAAGLPTMALLEESQQIALALAWLRNQGEAADTRWQAYILLLGRHNPAGWAKSPQQLAADHAASLHALGLDLSWWSFFVAQVQEQVAAEALALASRYGPALGVSAADVLWALGQVAARKVTIDNQVMLEPWSDLLRHPALAGDEAGAEASSSSSSRCEISWTYGLCRKGVGVVSRGSGVRIAEQHNGAAGSEAAPAPAAAAGSESSQEQQQQQQQQDEAQQLLLAAGEELWAASDDGQLFSSAVVEQGHLAPLTWYLQHGQLPRAFAGVNMRTSDLLDSWRQTVSPAAAANGGSASSSGGGGSGAEQQQQRPTVLWDYLTQQYQQDVLTVLAATPVQHQQDLMQWLMQPVTHDTAAADAAGREGSDAAISSLLGGSGAVVADVDPVAMIGVLDELLLAAIDAADEEGGEA